VLALLFVAFLLALLIGFDVGFSMIFSAWLGILAKPGEAIDMAMMSLSMISGVDSLCAGAGAAVSSWRVS
jgi:hypothetical protein